MDSALNITLDTTKDDLAVEIAGIITKLDEDCTAVPCSFTADIKTAADELLDANWTSLHAMKNAENVTHVLETVFLAFGRKICFAKGYLQILSNLQNLYYLCQPPIQVSLPMKQVLMI